MPDCLNACLYTTILLKIVDYCIVAKGKQTTARETGRRKYPNFSQDDEEVTRVLGATATITGVTNSEETISIFIYLYFPILYSNIVNVSEMLFYTHGWIDIILIRVLEVSYNCARLSSTF